MNTCIRKRRERNNDQSDEAPLTGQQEKVKFNPLIFLPPTVFDLLATSCFYVGLNLTYASSSQMLRGSSIIFTGLLSVVALKRRLKWFQWAGMTTVIAGLIIVGLSDFLSENPEEKDRPTDNILIGDILCVFAELFSAFQVVLEEKFVSKYDVDALEAVGWEGLFGFGLLSILMVPMYYIYVGEPFGNGPRGVLEDALDAFVQIGNSPIISWGLVGALLSIAFVNYAGMSVTKSMGSLTRMVLDRLRVISIWVVSLLVGWQVFSVLQLVGFTVLMIGMCFYNDVLIMPLIRRYCMPAVADQSNVTSTQKDEERGATQR